MAPNDQSTFIPEIAPPFVSLPENDRPDRQLHVAVIGSGISGLAAAWLLAERHRVTLFERDSRPGGHSNTVTLDLPEGRLAVDTGFIVFNQRTYPNLDALFAHLGVRSAETDMSFSASVDDGDFEYAGTDLNGLFLQRRNLLRPRMWRMIADILRFYRQARQETVIGVTLGAYLSKHGYSQSFINDHLLPMGGAIWSTSPRQMLDHPLDAFVRFCDNHGLLQIRNRPIWRTVAGGSRTYVERMLADRPIELKLNARISVIRRHPGGPEIIFSDGARQRFDQIVIATHADQALRLVERPTEQERSLLGAMRYIDNKAFLHGDESLMPRRRAAWSSWNVMSGDSETDRQICVSYWMNRLQHLPTARPVILTLNPSRMPRDDRVWAGFDYAHPLFDRAAVAAQRQLWSLQGQGGIWYCGAYFGAGFHEDGLQSGLAVAEQLGGVRRPWHVSAPSGRIHVQDAEDTAWSFPQLGMAV